MRRLLPLAVLAALAGCQTVTPEARIRDGLIRNGLQPRTAGCMAERLVDRLSLAQLRQLDRTVGLARKDVGAMTVDELVARLRAVGDPEIVAIVTRAGVGCWIAG